jgi:hypothetical protein
MVKLKGNGKQRTFDGAGFCSAIFAATGKPVRDLPLSSNNLFA